MSLAARGQANGQSHAAMMVDLALKSVGTLGLIAIVGFLVHFSRWAGSLESEVAMGREQNKADADRIYAELHDIKTELARGRDQWGRHLNAHSKN